MFVTNLLESFATQNCENKSPVDGDDMLEMRKEVLTHVRKIVSCM